MVENNPSISLNIPDLFLNNSQEQNNFNSTNVYTHNEEPKSESN